MQSWYGGEGGNSKSNVFGENNSVNSGGIKVHLSLVYLAAEEYNALRGFRLEPGPAGYVLCSAFAKSSVMSNLFTATPFFFFFHDGVFYFSLLSSMTIILILTISDLVTASTRRLGRGQATWWWWWWWRIPPHVLVGQSKAEAGAYHPRKTRTCRAVVNFDSRMYKSLHSDAANETGTRPAPSKPPSPSR